MTDCAPQVSIEMPRGAPARGGALEWVMASLTPPEGVVDVDVRVDGQPVGCGVRHLPTQVSVSTWCDTRGLPPGLHEVEVAGRWAGGGTASATLLLLVGLGEQADLALPPSGPSADIAAVPVSSPQLADQLARTALGGPPTALLDDTASLAPGALARIDWAFSGPHDVDVVIGDDASMLSEGRWIRWRKRSFQPEMLPSIDAIGPLLAVGPRAADVLCDALAPALEAGVYGLALELLDRGLVTMALRQVLALTPQARLPVDDAVGRGAVERLAARRGRPVAISRGRAPGLREVRWPLEEHPEIAVVIPSRTPELAARCVAALTERTDYPALRVVVVDSAPNGDIPAALNGSARDTRTVAYPAGESFNYQRAANLGAETGDATHVLFLNDDVVPLKPDWLTRMVELLTLPGVGIVGALLRHPDGRIQHAGVQIGEGYGHRYHDAPADAPGHRFELLVPGNAEAVTGACMLVRREVLEQLDGHDEDFEQAYGDVDFCFRAAQRGWRIAWCPGAELEHLESATFGTYVSAADIELFKTRWRRDRDVTASARSRT